MSRRLLRQPRTMLALTIAIVGFGVFSSSIGTGALPTDSLPPFGATAGAGSLSTVAELGDVNGDHIGDYAVGLPSANSDAGVVYVFLGQNGTPLPSTPTALDLANASFHINGHAGEMLGYTVVGDDVNDDGLADIAIGAPMAGAPGKSGGGAVYVVFGSPHPTDVATTTLSGTALSTDPVPATSTVGSRYDGFQQNSHTGMALAALPDVNGDGFNDLVVGAPDANLHRPDGGGVAVLYGKASGRARHAHRPLGEVVPLLLPRRLPGRRTTRPPATSEVDQHAGESVASVGDMTGDGLPDIAIGAPQADFNGADSGSVWIISGHIAPIVGCTQADPTGVCPWIKLHTPDRRAGLSHRRRRAGRWARLVAGRRRRPERRRHPRPRDRRGRCISERARRCGSGRRRARPGRPVTRNLAVSPPLQTIDGPEAGAGLGASLAAAGDVDGDAKVDMLAGAPGEASLAGAAYLVRGAPGTTSDLALASSKIAPAGAGCADRQRGRRGPRARRCGRRLARRRTGRQRQRRLVRRRRQRHARPAPAAQPARSAAATALAASAAAGEPTASAAGDSPVAARDAALSPGVAAGAAGHDHERPAGRRARGDGRHRPGAVRRRRRRRPPSRRRPRRSSRSARSRRRSRSTTPSSGKRVKVKPAPCRPRPKTAKAVKGK